MVLNKQLVKNVIRLCEINNIPNMIFYGSEGCGKKTNVRVLLSELYGPDIYDMHLKNYTVEQKNIDYQINESKYHFEIYPNNMGLNDKHILKDLINKISNTKNVINNNIKIIVIHNYDKISHTSQFAFRATLEKSTKYCRYIFLCNKLERIIDPIKSRCSLIRHPQFTHKEILSFLKKKKICSTHKNIDFEFIIQDCECNLKKILFHTLISKIRDTTYRHPGDILIDELADKISNFTNLSELYDIRNILYKLMSYLVDETYTLNRTINKLFNTNIYENKCKIEIYNTISVVQSNFHKCNRPIMLLENAIFNILYIIQKHNTT